MKRLKCQGSEYLPSQTANGIQIRAYGILFSATQYYFLISILITVHKTEMDTLPLNGAIPELADSKTIKNV